MTEPTTRPKIYLAGPDVFLADAAAIGVAKREICARYGLEGVFPGDTEIIQRDDLDAAQKAQAIYDENIAHIRNADGVIANLSPFRGPCSDDGTAFEVGFAIALGLPVVAYDNAAGSLKDKTEARRAADDPYAIIEDFGHPANLMLACSVTTPIISGPEPLAATSMERFELAVAAIAETMGVAKA